MTKPKSGLDVFTPSGQGTDQAYFTALRGRMGQYKEYLSLVSE